MPRSRSLAELARANRSATPVVSSPTGMSQGQATQTSTARSSGMSPMGQDMAKGAVEGAVAAKEAGTSMIKGAASGAVGGAKGGGTAEMMKKVASLFGGGG